MHALSGISEPTFADTTPYKRDVTQDMAPGRELEGSMKTAQTKIPERDVCQHRYTER